MTARAAVYVNNGVAYPVTVGRARFDSAGWCEVPVTISTGGPRSVLHNAGSLHWVQPSTVFEPGTVKKVRGGVEVRQGARSRVNFVSAITADPGHS